MLKIGEYQFLMLLLMMETKGNDRCELHQALFIDRCKQFKHLLINVFAILVGLRYGGTRDQATFGPTVTLSKCVVVRVKQVGILRV